jgi:hypothetical protein
MQVQEVEDIRQALSAVLGAEPLLRGAFGPMSR